LILGKPNVGNFMGGALPQCRFFSAYMIQGIKFEKLSTTKSTVKNNNVGKTFSDYSITTISTP
jgi:hypothetical protein